MLASLTLKRNFVFKYRFTVIVEALLGSLLTKSVTLETSMVNRIYVIRNLALIRHGWLRLQYIAA